MHKKIEFIILLVLGIVWMPHPVVTAQTGDAGQAGEFLRYGVGARALGMGHAFTGLADDASSIYWNPAGLMNVPRQEFTSMYTNLFFDSRYTFMAAALPRSFVGRHNAIGIGWVNMSMNDFDQRDAQNNPLGSFDVYEQAFLLSGARELVSSWGVFNYGANLKLINQGFPGYASGSGWGFGADIGATFRPINAPLFKLLPLRPLMPLQFGLSLQNIVQPKVGIPGGKKDKYPFIFRWGASYALCLAKSRVSILYDQEYYSGRRMGAFMGAEAEFASPFNGTIPYLRTGFNTRTKKPSFGGGLSLDYLKSATVHMDFAYAIKPHESLDNDFRFFLSIDFGKPYDQSYFTNEAESGESDREKKQNYLHVLTRFHDDNNLAVKAALMLASVYDSPNEGRYLDFMGGAEQADYLFGILKEKIAATGDPATIEKLKKFASKIDYIPAKSNSHNRFLRTLKRIFYCNRNKLDKK